MNKEQVYDEQIAPLMTQIIEICEKNNIGMLADFEIPNDEDPDLCCTSWLPGENDQVSHRHSLARRVLLGGVGALAFTVSGEGA